MNWGKEINRIQNFIRDRHAEAGKPNAVIGISGGVDSAVVVTLLVKTLGKNKVFGYMLPYGEQHDIGDSWEILGKLKLPYRIHNIKRIVDEATRTLGILGEDKRVGNIMARIRMTILYDKSEQHTALVSGTGNKTELALGYFTLHGDGACAYEPIGHLLKTEVKELAKILKVPNSIINKPPSAGLWVGQTDEKELGISYEQIDKYLSMIDKNKFKNLPPKGIE